MKILIAAATFTLTSLASAGLTPTISVEASVKTSHQHAKAGSETDVSFKQLNISLRGSNQVQGPVRVVCTFYAEDLVTRHVVPEKAQEMNATLEAGQITALESAAVTFTYTPQHSEKSSGSSSRRANYKRVEASGHRYHGWAVRVYQDGGLVGESSSLPGLGHSVGGE